MCIAYPISHFKTLIYRHLLANIILIQLIIEAKCGVRFFQDWPDSSKPITFPEFYKMFISRSILVRNSSLSVLLLVLFSADISLGDSFISPSDWFSFLFGTDDSTVSEIIWQFRLPKAITCLLAGSALATGGLLMQTLFRNPLAGPDVLGLSSGASLLVALILMLGHAGSGILQSITVNPWSLALAATLGSTLVFMLVIAITRFVKDNTSILIIGLMLSAATASIVGVLQFISKAEDLQLFMIWSLGNVGSTGWNEISVLLIVVVVGVIIAISQLKSLNGRLLGEIYAQSLGINLSRSRFWLVASTSLLVGGVTAFCGPITFVGLAVPHLVKLITPTSNHKILLPLVMIGGGVLLLFCDLLTHSIGSIILPLNAVTSMIGAPLVIWMIIKNKKVGL